MEAFEFIPDLMTLVGDAPTESIVSRAFYRAAKANAIIFGFAAGQELSEHSASHPAILHFLSGEARLTLGEEVKMAKAGTWVHMPAHLPHAILAQTPVTMLLLLLKS